MMPRQAGANRGRYRGVGNVSLPSAALVITGLLLVVLGLFAAGEITVVALGIVALVAAGIIEVLGSRRR